MDNSRFNAGDVNNQILPKGMIATATLTKLLEELKNLTDEEIAKLFSEVEVEKTAWTKDNPSENQMIVWKAQKIYREAVK